MSSSPSAGGGAPYDGGSMSPSFVRRQQEQQQQGYSFSGGVLLTAVVILAILTVVFVLVRLLLYQFVARGRGSLATASTPPRLPRSPSPRSFRSFGRRSGHGLDASALAALPVTTYRGRKPDDDDDDDGIASASASSIASAATVCAVCLSELAHGEKVRALPSCGHVFHVECVDAWLRFSTTCPVCRAEARPDKGAGGARPPTPPPALFGAGLAVTVEGGVAETRDAHTPVLGAAVNRPGP